MEKILQQLVENVAKLVKGQSQLVQGQSQIVKRLDIIDNHLVKIDTRIQENTNIITTLSVDMARSVTKKDTETIDNKIEVLNNRLLEQEAKTLTLVK